MEGLRRVFILEGDGQTQIRPHTAPSLFFSFILYVMVFSLHVCLCAVSAWCLWKPEDGARALRAGVRADCEPPAVGAGNLTWVLCKSSVGS